MNGDIGGAGRARCFPGRELTTPPGGEPPPPVGRSRFGPGGLGWGGHLSGGGAGGTRGDGRAALDGVLLLVVPRPVTPVRAQRAPRGVVAVPPRTGARRSGRDHAPRGSPRGIEHRLGDGAAVAAVGRYEHAHARLEPTERLV